MNQKFTRQILCVMIAWCFSLSALFAQAPAMFNYQGAVRQSNGQPLANKEIALRLTIKDGSADGNNQYQEVRNIRTNLRGLYSVQIGSPGGTQVSGSISKVTWQLD